MKLLEEAYISYLNLDHRVDRRAHMEREMERVGIRAERTPAVTRGPWPPERVAKMQARTPGAIGCWAGQVAIMEEAIRRGKHAFVMEDDLVFCSDFNERLQTIEGFMLGHRWDVFWFGGTFHVNPPVWHKDTLGHDLQRTVHPRIVRTFGCWSTYAYLVNRASIAEIISLLDSDMAQSVGIDDSFIRLEPRLQTFAFVPGCVKQYDGRSDIGDGMTIFSGFSKLGPYWWQDRMEDFDPDSFDWAEVV